MLAHFHCLTESHVFASARCQQFCIQQRGCKSYCGYGQATCHVQRVVYFNFEFESVAAKDQH